MKLALKEFYDEIKLLKFKHQQNIRVYFATII